MDRNCSYKMFYKGQTFTDVLPSLPFHEYYKAGPSVGSPKSYQSYFV